MEKENHIQDGNFQTGFAQKRDKVIFLKCKFCHKMIKKVRFAEHVMISHLGNERVINERLNEIVKDQYKRKKESGNFDIAMSLTEHNIKTSPDAVDRLKNPDDIVKIPGPKNHDKGGVPVCPLIGCTKTFRKMGLLSFHLSTVHKFACITCRKDFLCQDNLQNHISRFTKSQHQVHANIPSPNFSESLLKSYGFKLQLETGNGESAIPDMLQESVANAPKKDLWVCPICSIDLKTRRILRDHITSLHKGQKPFECLTCNARFVMEDSLKKHHKSWHVDQVINVATEKITNQNDHPVESDINNRISHERLMDQNFTIELPSMHEEMLILNETMDRSCVNPWQVDSIESFKYLKCPECVFETKEKTCFQNHAIENHPLSHALFGKKDNNLIILDFDPNGFDSDLNENSKTQFVTNLMKTSMLEELPIANMLQYSFANSSEVSLIKEELNGETYFVEQVNETSGYEKSNFEEQPHNDVLESNFENQTVIHMTNIDKETIFEENTDPAPKKEYFENNSADKNQFETEIAHDKQQLDSNFLEDPTEADENITSISNSIEKKIQCEICDVAFLCEDSLKSHIESLHNEIENLNVSHTNNSDEEVLNVAPLETTSKNSPLVSEPTDNYNKSSNKMLINCKFCKMKTNSKADMEIHVLSIHGGKRPECSICNTSFSQDYQLIKHMRNVHNEKPSYSCHICGKKTVFKEYMKKHIAMVHEGKKLFKCQMCDKSFSMKSGKDL